MGSSNANLIFTHSSVKRRSPFIRILAKCYKTAFILFSRFLLSFFFLLFAFFVFLL